MPQAMHGLLLASKGGAAGPALDSVRVLSLYLERSIFTSSGSERAGRGVGSTALPQSLRHDQPANCYTTATQFSSAIPATQAKFSFTSPAHPLRNTSRPFLPVSPLFSQRSYVQLATELAVADNSGAKRLACIKVLKGAKPNAAGLGDIIICSVKDAIPRGKVKKGEVVTAVVVRSAMHHERSDGSFIRFDDSAAVVITKAGEPIGTRVFGPVPHELREKNFLKILTLARHVT